MNLFFLSLLLAPFVVLPAASICHQIEVLWAHFKLQSYLYELLEDQTIISPSKSNCHPKLSSFFFWFSLPWKHQSVPNLWALSTVLSHQRPWLSSIIPSSPIPSTTAFPSNYIHLPSAPPLLSLRRQTDSSALSYRPTRVYLAAGSARPSQTL